MVIDKIKKINKVQKRVKNEKASDMLIGKWIKCDNCKEILYKEEVHNNFSVCPNCGKHFRISARRRIKQIIDEGTFEEIGENLETADPLNFEGYLKKAEMLKQKTKIDEAVKCGTGKINGKEVAIAIMDGNFMMGSIGSCVGERITLTIETSIEKRIPLIIFCVSGGARMQEGIISLMQMAKTSAALAKHNEAGLLYISVLTDPTTGGVTASFASLGDVILAEPNALIGFAGPRVIEQTIKQKLPEGFQRAEFLLQHGFIDKIVERKDMKETLYKIINCTEKKRSQVCNCTEKKRSQVCNTPKKSDLKCAWEKVCLARMAERSKTMEYINEIFTDFIELHGDRCFGDDKSIIGGIALLGDIPVTVIGEQKGKNIKENMERNFGMPNPEGYRKALRLMKQAEKFNRPIITFIDTPGAYPGMGAEERGQGEAIARSICEMSNLKVPIICVVIGEGSSGGALAIGVGDRIVMLENAVYSILSPEGFASILYKDSGKAKEAAENMKITAKDLQKFEIVDKIIEEPESGVQDDFENVANNLKVYITDEIQELELLSKEELIDERYKKFRKIGQSELV
ncbi:acetyl-coenzyme A carboxylase carboxyl transferase subunits beta/alpha [Clostridium sp. CAG:356]|nr:acetyl-coenzyme A carboxylase carboxyl transferase subunits beta/alpha [Clostridium sp. CAG:356]